MSCNYCWNQPKKYERYDLYLDGKIKADDFVYRTKDADSGEIISSTLSEKIDKIEERLATHFAFNTDYATITDLESAFNNGELKDTVIYIVKNETVSDNPDSRDSYNEYMVVTVKDDEGNETKTLELIGSGSYAKHEIDVKVETDRATARENEIQSVYDSITGYSFEKLADGSKQNIDNRIKQEISDRIANVKAEEDRALEAESVITAGLDGEAKRAAAEEKRIDEKIDKEISDRKSDVSTVTASIATEKGRIDTIINQNLDARITAIEVMKLKEVIDKLTKEIVVLELDKGYKIAQTSAVEMATVVVSTDNLQLGDNEVVIKTDYQFGSSKTLTNNCTVNVADDGTLSSAGVTVNVNDSYDVEETRDEKLGLATYTLTGTINVSISGTHKNPQVTVDGALENGQSFELYPEPSPTDPEEQQTDVTEGE